MKQSTSNVKVSLSPKISNAINNVPVNNTPINKLSSKQPDQKSSNSEKTLKIPTGSTPINK